MAAAIASTSPGGTSRPSVTEDLGVGGDVGGDDRAAPGDRFEHRQTEALVDRRGRDDRGLAVQRVERRIGDATEPADAGLVEGGDGVAAGIQPTGPAMTSETSTPRARSFADGGDDHVVLLARFDRPGDEHVRTENPERVDERACASGSSGPRAPAARAAHGARARASKPSRTSSSRVKRDGVMTAAASSLAIARPRSWNRTPWRVNVSGCRRNATSLMVTTSGAVQAGTARLGAWHTSRRSPTRGRRVRCQSS